MNGRATFADQKGRSRGVFAVHNLAPCGDFGGRGNHHQRHDGVCHRGRRYRAGLLRADDATGTAGEIAARPATAPRRIPLTPSAMDGPSRAGWAALIRRSIVREIRSIQAAFMVAKATSGAGEATVEEAATVVVAINTGRPTEKHAAL